jgi:hypothetical protein
LHVGEAEPRREGWRDCCAHCEQSDVRREPGGFSCPERSGSGRRIGLEFSDRGVRLKGARASGTCGRWFAT